MKNIILVANEDEANQLSVDNLNCDVIITGEGRTNVIQTLTDCLKEGVITDEKNIINVGYVGGKGFNKGDVVSIDEVGLVKPSLTIKEPNIFLDKSNQTIRKTMFDWCKSYTTCLTSENFVNSDDIPYLPEQCVCDMELYWIALMFPKVISIKIVSDTLNYNEYKDAKLHESWNKVYQAVKEIL